MSSSRAGRSRRGRGRRRRAVRRRPDDGAEIGREGEERPGHRLGGTVAGEERVVADPARTDDGIAQQWQHHMAAAEHQGARTVEGFEQSAGPAKPTGRAGSASRRAAGKRRQAPKTRPCATPAPAIDRTLAGGAPRQSHRPAMPPTRMAAIWAAEAAARQDDERCDCRDRGAFTIGSERAGHAPHRLGDDRHGDQFQAVQQAGTNGSFERARPG